MYSSYGVVGELNSDLLAEDPENISNCYFAVILDFFDSLESGLLSGLEKTPIAFFSESVFLTFAHSVCTKWSSFGHVLGFKQIDRHFKQANVANEVVLQSCGIDRTSTQLFEVPVSNWLLRLVVKFLKQSMEEETFATNLFANIYLTWIDVEEHDVFPVLCYVPEQDASACFFSVILDCLETLESGILKGLETSAAMFFSSESLFSEFAYSVCLRLSTSNDIDSLILVGVFLINAAHFSFYMNCFCLTNTIPDIFLKFFKTYIEHEFSAEEGFANLRRFCDSFKKNEISKHLIIADAVRIIDESIKEEISIRGNIYLGFYTVSDVMNLKRECEHQYQSANACSFCGTCCVVHLNSFFTRFMLNSLTKSEDY
ncbi:hypothetical protein CDAR_511251 [Caerostris darwini]|uniref:Odorant receptor n=1 Tax=Caerostris darwini TaxID=1538125 RepID=A0AAV4S262_9ARAC|nr:hypothetical protein CDAR_511251 [Caerostris darwini]